MVGRKVDNVLRVFGIYGKGVELVIGQAAEDILGCCSFGSAGRLALARTYPKGCPVNEEGVGTHFVIPDEAHLPVARDRDDGVGDIERSRATR